MESSSSSGSSRKLCAMVLASFTAAIPAGPDLFAQPQQPKEFQVVIQGESIKRVPIAIPRVAAGGGLASLAEEVHQVLADDLAYSGYFDIVDPSKFSGFKAPAPESPDLKPWRSIGADAVAVFADVKKKHSAHAMTADMDIAETARAAEFFLADGVIVTGTSTGRPADREEVAAVAAATSIPTLVGSGITPDNIAGFGRAEAFIVGTSPKREGLWSNPVDPARAAALVKAFATLGAP